MKKLLFILMLSACAKSSDNSIIIISAKTVQQPSSINGSSNFYTTTSLSAPISDTVFYSIQYNFQSQGTGISSIGLNGFISPGQTFDKKQCAQLKDPSSATMTKIVNAATKAPVTLKY